MSKLQEFKTIYKTTIEKVALIADDDLMKENHGFTVTDVINQKYLGANTLRKVSAHLDKVAKDTGELKVVGGSVAFLSGLAMGLGIVLAPFSAGVSLALTTAGTVGGVLSSATSVSASITKAANDKSDSEAINELLSNIENMDNVISDMLTSLNADFEKLQDYAEVHDVLNFLNDPIQLALWSKSIGWDVGKGILVDAPKILKITSQIAKFSHVLANQFKVFVAGQYAAGGLQIGSKTLITAGGTTAKAASAGLALFGIASGIWDVVDGVGDIKEPSEHSKAYRNIANALDDQHDQLLDYITNDLKSPRPTLLMNTTTDEQFLKGMHSLSYKDSTKTKLTKHFRDSDRRLVTAKYNYGNGTSVKGMVLNISALHYLVKTNQKKEIGRSWSDEMVREPTNSIGPLQYGEFFDAEDSVGCHGGCTYRLIDAESFIVGYVAIAWKSIHDGHLVYCVMASKNETKDGKDDILQLSLDYCATNSVSKVDGRDLAVGNPCQYIFPKEEVDFSGDGTDTSYLHVGIKADGLASALNEN